MLRTIRLFFIFISGIAGYLLIFYLWGAEGNWPFLGVVFGVVGAGVIILLESAIRHISTRGLSAVVFGLIFGLIMAMILIFFIRLIPMPDELRTGLNIMLTLILCYLGVVMALRSKDDFNLIIPYVRLTREDQPQEIVILDTSAIIDGRIADIIKTGFVESRLVIPRFVLKELQKIADSEDSLRRNRGRRGLDTLNDMQKDKNVMVRIHDEDFPDIKEVDAKLVKLAKITDAKILTTDFNLNKVAEIQGVKVLNINGLANALKPVVLPGELLEVKVVKEGKEYNQGVGYLEDGTMIVVEDGRRLIGQTKKVTVTSVLQTQAGKMIFSQFERKRRTP